jgi:flagellar hook-associated protein 1 FlgK
MGTLVSLLNISEQALGSDQAALNATANNISNQNTPGYTRENVNFSTVDYYTPNGTFVPDGVSVSAPVSTRDRVLEQRVQQQTQLQSQSATLQSALNNVQDVFGLNATSTTSSLTALGNSINSFFNSLTQLQSSPADSPTRQQVLAAASTLASTFNSTSSQLSQITSGLQAQAQVITGQANTLLSTIAHLNEQIATSSPYADAGVLEDQRQQAITQLSQYVGLDQITNSQNQIELTTTNGGLLVAGQNSYALQTSVSNGVVTVLAGPNSTDVTAGLTGGSLGGTLEALNTSIPPIQNSIDSLAYSIATSVNTLNEEGDDATGQPGQALFNIGADSTGAAATISTTTSNPNLVAAASTGEGSSGNSNATALAALANQNLVGGETVANYLATSLAQIGEAASLATNSSTAQQATLTQLTTQVNSVSGVSLDEEASNLTEFQRSYQAASQLFNIVDSLFVSAINFGVETAVS